MYRTQFASCLQFHVHVGFTSIKARRRVYILVYNMPRVKPWHYDLSLYIFLKLVPGGFAIVVHRGRVSSPRPFAGARSFQARPAGGHVPADLQHHDVDHLHVRDAESRGQSGPVGVLRVLGVGHRAAHHATTLHIPSVPFGRHSGRNLEDQLQGASRVKFFSSQVLHFPRAASTMMLGQISSFNSFT